jgi:hypothetical protein
MKQHEGNVEKTTKMLETLGSAKEMLETLGRC